MSLFCKHYITQNSKVSLLGNDEILVEMNAISLDGIQFHKGLQKCLMILTCTCFEIKSNVRHSCHIERTKDTCDIETDIYYVSQ